MTKISKNKKEVDAIYEEETPNTIKKEVTKKESTVIESPIKSGMSETTKGMIVGIVITALIAIIIILLILGKNDSDNKTTSLDPAKYSAAMKEFYEYFESDELTLIVFASSQCSYCVAQEPIVKNIDETYEINYLYMDYLKLSSDAEIEKVIEELGLSSGSTPTSVVVKDGKVVKKWVGYIDGENYVKNLISAGMLKKGDTYKQEENLTSIDFSKFKNLLNDSKVSAVIFDAANCTSTCNDEREFLNDIANDNDVSIYHLSASAFSEKEQTEFIDGLGNWGYDASEYKSNKSVSIPLLLFMKNGKIVDYYVGFESKDDITKMFKDVGLTK